MGLRPANTDEPVYGDPQPGGQGDHPSGKGGPPHPEGGRHPFGRFTPDMRGTSYLATVTPEMAADVLARFNTANRHLKENHVQTLARSVAAGHWVCTGDPIIFDRAGTLVDGQHRLAACVRAGAAVKVFVHVGAPDAARRVVDTVAAGRTYSDLVTMSGRPNAVTLASSLRVVHGYEGLGHRDNKLFTATYDSATLDEALARYEGIEASASYANSSPYLKKAMTPRVLAASHYLFGMKSPAQRDEFFAGLRSGGGLEDGSPVLTLRNRLIADSRSPEQGISFAYRSLYLTVAGWNAYREGRTMSRMVVRLRDTADGRRVPEYIPDAV